MTTKRTSATIGDGHVPGMSNGSADDAAFETLLDYLKRTRGFDFTAYKRSSLSRRILKRMQALSLEDYSDYVDYLEVHPDEFAHLFNTILINVTDFFRDEPAWTAISESIVPRILAIRTGDAPIRVWSAGCASGQEAYTIAMILNEALGEDAFRQRVKIYATDVDEEALNEARQAAYTAQQVQSVPVDWRDRYFEPVNGRFVFRKDMRRSIIFGRHDLVQDAPISRVDMLICRNTLMYFNAEAQARILNRFDFALNGSGFLFLGKAEVLLTRSAAFAPVDLKRRIFGKAAKGRARSGVLEASSDGRADLALTEVTENTLRDVALEMDLVAQVVLNLDGLVVMANAQARLLFNIRPADLRQRLDKLQMSYRLLELRHKVQQAAAERRPLHLREVEWLLPSGDRRFFDVIVIPLFNAEDTALGVKIVFNDVSNYRQLQEDLNHSQQELETANEELQSANEELETTNEELQSTVEEMETTNEELQSTNEELETMNEELQSMNEEMDTSNAELRVRGEELNDLNAFLESILASMRQGVVVLDRNLSVIAWNSRAENLWGLRPEEARGQNFFALDIGLPVERLNPMIRACMSEDGVLDEKPLLLESVNRRGKTVTVEVTCNRLRGPNNRLQGVILAMEERNVDGTSL